jgi:hypothetical protein
MHRRRRALVRALRKLSLKDYVTFASLASQVIALVRALAGHG